MARTISHVEIVLFAKIACYEGDDFDEATINRLHKEIPAIENENSTFGNWLGIAALENLIEGIQKLGFNAFGKLLKIRKNEAVSKHIHTNRPETISKLQEVYPSRISTRFAALFAGKDISRFLDYLADRCRVPTLIIPGPPELEEEDEDFETDDLLDTVWYLYHYQYPLKNNLEIPYTEVTRLVAHFYREDFRDVIDIYEKEEADDWSGDWSSLDGDKVRSFVEADLEQHETTEKPLHLRFFKHQVKTRTVLMGQFIDSEENTSIVSGSFILQNALGADNIPGDEERGDRRIEIKVHGKIRTFWVVTRKLSHHDTWRKYIPQEIARFLSNKWRNFTKVNGVDIYSLRSLGHWLTKKDADAIKDKKYNEIIEYDMMIVTNTPKPDDMILYDEISKTFFKYPTQVQIPNGEEERGKFLAHSDLEKPEIGFSRIYYAPRLTIFSRGLERLGKLPAKQIIDEELQAMRKSRCVLLILSEKMSSNALIKIGWAMAMEKVCFVVETSSGLLPKLLRREYDKKIYLPEDTHSVKDIPDALLTMVVAGLLD